MPSCKSQPPSCRRGRRRQGALTDRCAASRGAAAQAPVGCQKAPKAGVWVAPPSGAPAPPAPKASADDALRPPSPRAARGDVAADVARPVQEGAVEAAGREGEAAARPEQSEEAPSDVIMAGVTALLRESAAIAREKQQQTEGSDAHASDTGSTVFHAKSVPRLSIDDYLRRIRQHQPCSDQCFVFALVYLDRIAQQEPWLSVTDLTSHRLFLTAIMLATRFHDDEEDVHYNNAWFAKLGGLGLTELGLCEARFLEFVGWRLSVSLAEYEAYHDRVRRAMRAFQREGLAGA